MRWREMTFPGLGGEGPVLPVDPGGAARGGNRAVPAPVMPNATTLAPATAEAEQLRLQTMQQMGQLQPPPPLQDDIHVLSIIGQVEGHFALPPKNKTTKYEHLIPQLVAIEQSSQIKGLLVLLNTVGGDIEAGLAIAEMIRSLSKPKVSLILGGGHSIGVPIAVSADYSFIAPTASMTIHPVRLTGLVVGVPQMLDYLDKVQERIIRFITVNSRISKEKLRELMFRTGDLVRDVGSVLVGSEAVEVGLIDAVGGVSDALAKLRELIHQAGVSRPGASPAAGSDAPPGTAREAPAADCALPWAAPLAGNGRERA